MDMQLSDLPVIETKRLGILCPSGLQGLAGYPAFGFDSQAKRQFSLNIYSYDSGNYLSCSRRLVRRCHVGSFPLH